MSIRDDVIKMKAAAPLLAAASSTLRNQALSAVSATLKERQEDIFRANKTDLEAAEKNNIPESVIKRLKFDEHKLQDVVSGIEQLISLPDPIGKVSLNRELDEGLTLSRISCPIGVIGVIFEARPDALVQIATLCIKSGNCAILKGGRETASTNKVLFEIIHETIINEGIPADCMLLASTHSEIDELLGCVGFVDLLIPRGSNAFVKYIMDNTQIPVMGHADGICHIYVDEYGDFDMAKKIIIDAKTQYTAACNSVETILVNKNIAKDFLPMLVDALKEAEVNLLGDDEVRSIVAIEPLTSEGYKEYLALTASVKLVKDTSEAVSFINSHGSHHTDAIITDNRDNVEYFLQMVDSAGVYHNCSTRFADGFRYGFGAEVGISTSKLHARGPVGLEGLLTYKYKLLGRGQIVGDYATGKAKFNFKDI